MKNILIVDDSESIREVVSHTLSGEGFNIIKGIDGTDALKKMDGEKVDLIITDLHMPNMDGIELIRKVRAWDEFTRIPILMLTTETQTKSKLEAKAAGATGWIVKPFAPAKLISAVRKVLR